LETLKKEYIAAYADHHHRRVLDIQGDERRKKLYNDRDWKRLRNSAIWICYEPLRDRIDRLAATISGLQTCRISTKAFWQNRQPAAAVSGQRAVPTFSKPASARTAGHHTR